MARTPRARADWRAAFLRGLARGAGAGAAAAAAGVHYQTPFHAKRRDRDFAAAWAAAAATGRAEVAAGAIPALRPDEVVGRSKTGPCIRRAGATRWSAGKERLFLDELAASANVARAAAAAGLSRTAIMRHRRDEAGFAARWDAALAQGWALVEAALVRAAAVTLGGLPAAEDAPEVPPPQLTAAEAITLWKAHRAEAKGEADGRALRRRAEPSMDEVRAEVLRRVRAMGG